MVPKINSEEFIAFDLETTGLNPVVARILEIGAVRFRGDGKILDCFQQLVDPSCAISAGAMAVNGITAEMVSGQPGIDEVLPHFNAFIGEMPVLMMAHNAGFDLGFLAVAYYRQGLKMPEHPVFDTLAMARCRLNLLNYKLETVGSSFGLIDKAKHRALEDALLVKDVFLKMRSIKPSLDSTDELLSLFPNLSFHQFTADPGSAPEGYEALWDAINNDKPIEMNYLGGSSPGTSRVITPLGITQVSGAIYLSAFCHKSKLNKTFRLDRIASYRRID